MSRPVLVALLLCPTLAIGQDHTTADLAVRARAVLETHCLGCHGDKPIRSTVKILDSGAMTAAAGPDRPIAFFGKTPADASLALDLIKEGSMPPGSLSKVPDADVAILEKWVASGAANYPKTFDDEFAHTKILEDVKSLKAFGPSARYLSLHHVAATAPAELETARREFQEALKNLVKRDAAISWVDETDTICRIDLVQSGWDYPPFSLLDDEGNFVKNRPKPTATLFDLVLLEYPHAVIPRDSATFNELARVYLLPAAQVRPVPFVRGDWFVATVMKPEFANELRLLTKKGWSYVPPGLVEDRARKLPAVRPGPAPSPNDVLLPALDAWYASEDPPDSKAVKGFAAETIDPKSKLKEKKTEFKPDDVFALKITAEAGAHLQYLYVDLDGRVDNRTNVTVVSSVGYLESKDLPSGGFAAKFGTERLHVFAAPHKFPDGERWGAADLNIFVERFVHPFFPQDPKTGRVDLTDAKVTRKTATIKVVK
jgi:mono/diheme cytochrome c family protein